MYDVIRYILICGGALILGFNIAVFKNAERITGSPRAWRVYIFGDSLLTVYVMASLADGIHKNLGLTWRIPVAAFAIVLTIAGLIALNGSFKKMQQLRTKGEHG